MQWPWMPWSVHSQAQANPREGISPLTCPGGKEEQHCFRAGREGSTLHTLGNASIQEGRRNSVASELEGRDLCCALLAMHPAWRKDKAAGSEHVPLWCWPMNPEPAISLQEKLIAEAVAGSLVVPRVWLRGGQQLL